MSLLQFVVTLIVVGGAKIVLGSAKNMQMQLASNLIEIFRPHLEKEIYSSLGAILFVRSSNLFQTFTQLRSFVILQIQT